MELEAAVIEGILLGPLYAAPSAFESYYLGRFNSLDLWAVFGTHHEGVFFARGAHEWQPRFPHPPWYREAEARWDILKHR